MTDKVVLNKKGMDELLNSQQVRDLLTAHGEKVLSEAQATAPVDTGEYRDSLHIEQATTDRAVVRVVAGTDHDWIVEARHGTLARALDAAGGA